MKLDMQDIGRRAKAAARALAAASATAKRDALCMMADAVVASAQEIFAANAEDLEAARAHGMSEAMLDRLRLNEARLTGMADGMRKVAAMPDPVGRVLDGDTLVNGLRLERRTVPFGVIGVIYEARPNVTGDAAALCFKSGNACILRGGSEAIRSNAAIAHALWRGLERAGMDPDSVILIEDTSRESAAALMRMNGYVDLLIPRGGAGLIRSVVENATVPVIETGVGNCHVYVEKTADIDMAAEIVFNAKTSRPSVCNAAGGSGHRGAGAAGHCGAAARKAGGNSRLRRNAAHSARGEARHGRGLCEGIPGLYSGGEGGRRH